MDDDQTMDLFGAGGPRTEYVSVEEAVALCVAKTSKTLKHVDPDWMRAALQWAIALPRPVDITADDMTRVIGMPPGHPNGVGAAWRAMSTIGLFRPTGRFVRGLRRSRHGGAIAVWST